MNLALPKPCLCFGSDIQIIILQKSYGLRWQWNLEMTETSIMYIHTKIGVWTTPILIAKGFWLQRWSVEFFNGMQVCHCSRKDLDCWQELKYGSTVWTRWLNAINRNHHLVQHLLNTNYTPDTEPEAQNSTVIEKEKTRGKKIKEGIFSRE